MTIRTRLTLTQIVIGGAVIALCVLAIDLARMAIDLASTPAQHLRALGHVHDLYDSVGQAVKDLDDIAKGEEGAEELGEQMERAREALADIREDADDVQAVVLVH